MSELIAFIFGALMAGILAWQGTKRLAIKNARTEKQLLRRTRRAERLAEIGRLTGNLAHEIRNPLSIIKINLKLLSEDMQRQLVHIKQSGVNVTFDSHELKTKISRQEKKINTLANETDRLSNTLNDFMEFAGKMELHQTNADINQLLDSLIDFYEPQANAMDIQMRRDLSATPAICFVDIDRIKQSILNLLINATQAMDTQSGELIIQSNISPDNHIVTIDIIDTGPGIALNKQEKIFDAYYTSKAGGSGLGLPTCRRVIEEHDGQIHLDSEPGVGTRFTISLPMVK